MWDERYDTHEYVYGTEPNDFLASVADRIPAGRVLSIGEGEGRNAVFLASLGYEVTAVDASAVGLRKVERLAWERGLPVTTVHADLADFAIEPDAWDGIVSIFCHLPRALRLDVHRRVSQGLAPGGVFVVEAYTPRQLEFGTGGPKDPEMLVRLADLREDLPGLSFELAREVDRPVAEGRFHDGMSAVVQVVARRPR